MSAHQHKARTVTASLVSFVLCSSCAYLSAPKPHIPSEIVVGNAPGPHTKLIVVLPGIGDTVANLRRFGIAESMLKSMPDADVALIGLTLPYYMKTPVIERLHDEVIVAAREHGYRDIYLAGASMGGMGALMYERQHPNVVRGLILMAPFMGDEALLEEINAAGGLADWNPGPVAASNNGTTAPRENWRIVKSWSVDSSRARDVWLICGEDDKFHSAAMLIASQLPKQNYFPLQGGHRWTVWAPGAEKAFAAIGQQKAKPTSYFLSRPSRIPSHKIASPINAREAGSSTARAAPSLNDTH